MRTDICVSSNHVRHNVTQSMSISSYVDDGACRICDSWDDVVRSNRFNCVAEEK